jgi:hypothetical protein
MTSQRLESDAIPAAQPIPSPLSAEPGDDGIFFLASPEGLSPHERHVLTLDPIPLSDENDPGRPLTQFSLRELMALVTFFSAGMAVIYYLPADKVAGVLGVLALVGQGLLMRFPPENRHVLFAAWFLLAMYFVAAATALAQHFLLPHF